MPYFFQNFQFMMSILWIMPINSKRNHNICKLKNQKLFEICFLFYLLISAITVSVNCGLNIYYQCKIIILPRSGKDSLDVLLV
jgi:hypothetical protein